MNKHLIYYVYNCKPIVKTFHSEKKLDLFIKKLTKDLEENGGSMNGYWIDLIVRDIHGKIKKYV